MLWVKKETLFKTFLPVKALDEVYSISNLVLTPADYSMVRGYVNYEKDYFQMSKRDNGPFTHSR